MDVDIKKEIRERKQRECKCGAILESDETRCDVCVRADTEWEARQPRGTY